MHYIFNFIILDVITSSLLTVRFHFKQLEYSKLRSLLPHQKFLNKKKKKKKRKTREGSSRAARVNRGDSCSPLYENPENSHRNWRGCAGRGRGVFFSFRRERRAILNETTHEESFLNQLVEVRELRKRVPRRARCPPRARSPSRRRSLLFDDGTAERSYQRGDSS